MMKQLFFANLLFISIVARAFSQAIPGKWTLTWSDEFNNPSDLDGWTRQTGGGGWGNQELETYTDSKDNAFVSTDPATKKGVLTVRAIVSGDDTKSYTSARLNSPKQFDQAGGLFEFRAKLPKGQGLWPAIWMMSRDEKYGSWPRSGEIDILESLGQELSLVQGSLHSGADQGAGHITQTLKFAATGKEPKGFSTTDWHTYDLRWDIGTKSKSPTIEWSVDGIVYETIHKGWHVPKDAASIAAPFDQPFYILLNMAVGGMYGGEAKLSNGNYDLLIDYVRAYRLTGATTRP